MKRIKRIIAIAAFIVLLIAIYAMLTTDEKTAIATEEPQEEQFHHTNIKTAEIEEYEPEPAPEWSGAVLNPIVGRIQGISGEETYYNLPMDGVLAIMTEYGWEETDYWIREDGVKMLGDYVMCAANLEIRPRGSIIETTLGTAIVCDTGEFVQENPYQIDIAVNW